MVSQQDQLSLLNEKETARRLGASPALLRKWRRLGQGPEYVKLGRAVRYDSNRVEEYVRAHTVGSVR